MKKLLFLLTVVTSLQTLQAQSWQWGRRGGGGGGSGNQAEKIVDMATDKNGNVYMLAQLDGGSDAVVSIDGTQDSALKDKLQGSRDAVLLSYNCSGKLRWLKVLGSASDEYAAGMTMDSLGHIYVSMETDMNFYVDIDSFAANPKRKSIGLMQYDTAGHFKWLRQPNPDSVAKSKNLREFRVYNAATTAIGDTYLFCILGTGLIAGSTNLVVTQPGFYMLKYNIAGIPKELIKLDMSVSKTSAFSYTSFAVTKSRKIIFEGVKVGNTSQFTSYPIVDGQFVKHSIFLCCFSPTGSVLCRVENSDTVGGLFGRPIIDENKGLIYTCGVSPSNGTNRHDTIQGFVVKNIYNPTMGSIGLPMFMATDTLGIVKMVKNGYQYSNGSSFLSSLAIRTDGRLFAFGDGGDIEWGAYKFDGGYNTGYQIFMPSFDATTGNIMSMDSLRGFSTMNADVITADNNNNIFVGGQLSSDVSIAGQTLQSNGGQSDFFVAKFGTANCSTIVPLKFTSYTVSSPLLGGGGFIQNNWQTANEINVSHFNIQRSTNGKDFENIGVTMAKNKATNNYKFIDQFPIYYSPFTTLYYRLESVDYDGQKQYSEIKTLTINHLSSKVNIYPNPANTQVVISCANAKAIEIVDYLGKIIVTKNSTNLQTTINAQGWAKGIYLVKILLNTGEIKTEKLVVE